MKKHIYLYVLILVLATGKTYAQCNTWVPLQVDDTIQASFGSASYTSISSTSVPGFPLPYSYMVYSDGMVGGKASVIYPVYGGTNKWAYLGTQGFTAGQALYTCIELGAKSPYMAYQDMNAGGKASAMWWTGTIWKQLGSAGFSPGTATYISMAVSHHNKAFDTVYVAFSDGGNSNKLSVMKYTGSTWVNVGSAGFSTGAASDISLQVDSTSGTLYVAYSDAGNGFKATAYKSTGAAWTALGPAGGLSANKASYISLNVLNPGNIYVAYRDSASSNKGKAMRYNGGTWSPYGSPTGIFTKGPASYISMSSVNPTNSLVVYNDDSLGFANVVYDSASTPGTWVQWGNRNFSAGKTSYDCISYLPTGGTPTPFVVYRDSRVGGKATVMVAGQQPKQPWGYAFPPRGISVPSSYCYNPSIAINTIKREPYVAFVNSDTNKELTMAMSYGGSNWTPIGPAISAGRSRKPSIAINRDTTYVAYIDIPSGKYPFVKKFNGTSWVAAGNTASGQVIASACTFISLAFDNANQPYVAFDDGTQGGKVTVEYCKNGVWTVLGSPGFNTSGGGSTASFISMAIYRNHVYVAFVDAGQSNQIILWEYNGSWSQVNGGVGLVSNGPAAYTSIAVDSSETIYVAFQDSTLTPPTAFVNEYVQGSGLIQAIVPPGGLTSGIATGESIALDSLGNPYVSFIDGTVNNKVTVMQYAPSGPWPVVGSAGLSAGAAVQTTQLALLGTTPFVTYQDRGAIVKRYAPSPTSMTITPALSVICQGKSITLTANGGTSPYTWSPASGTNSTASVSPSSTTAYTVKSNIGGCPATATAIVDVSNSGNDIFTIAGSGNQSFGGDGGSALASSMYYTTSVVFDSTYSNMYIADQQNAVVRKVNMATNIITTIAGNYAAGPGYTGDGNQATFAQLNWPSGLAIYKRYLYVADQVNNAVRRINLTTGIITTVAGDGTLPASSTAANGDGGQGTAAQLANPTGIAFDKSGNMYIADAGDNKIRELSPSGIINTYAGTGTAGYAGDGLSVNPLTGIELDNPTSVAIDANNDVIVADKDNDRVRKIPQPLLLLVTAATIAGNGVGAPLSGSFSGDGGQATAAGLYHPLGVAIDASGNIYISDVDNNRIRVVNGSGIINTFAGNGTAAASSTAPDGDGGPALSAQLNYPWAVTFDGAGNIYIPDNFNNRVREVKICSVPTTTISATKTSVCAGSPTTITVTGAATGSFYSWSPATGLNSVTTASVIATPSTTTIYSVTINNVETDTITIHVLPSPTVSATGATSICTGASDTLLAKGSGGTSYTWQTGSSVLSVSTTPTYTVVTPTTTTTYSLIASNGTCTDTSKITVTVGGSPVITVTTSPGSVCRGSNDTLTATGASAYTWLPSTNLNTTSGAVVIATPPTSTTVTYTVTGIATGGCNATGTVAVTVKAKPNVTATATPAVICLGGSTVLNASGSGFYSWSTGATTSSINPSPSATSTYTVIGTTSLGCSDTTTVSVIVNDTIKVVVNTINDSCYGICDGDASAAALGGTTPYTYSWSGGATGTTATINKLCVGTYTVIVKDKNGCIGFATTPITQPTALKDTITSFTSPTCNGNANGTATDLTTGGTSPYTYAWSNGQTSAKDTGLSIGTYTLIATDNNKCKATLKWTVTQPAPLSVTVSSTNVNCFGSATGVATANVSGGSGSFTYSWSDGQTTSTASGLIAGSYTVNITDINGCPSPAPATVTITQPTQLTDSINNVTGEKCNGGKTATATINVSGGTPGYKYSWNDGEKTSSASALPAGLATCIVTDLKGCIITDTVTIAQPSAIIINNDNITICPGGVATLNASASGSVGPYTYYWGTPLFDTSHAVTVSPVITTSYTVTVTNANKCTNTMVDIVTVAPPIVQGTISATSASSCIGTPVTLTDVVTGGSGSLTYTWQPGGSTGSSIVVNPVAGTTAYTVIVTDGCASSTLRDSINVTMYNPAVTVCCDTTILAGQSVNIITTPSSGLSYVWSPSTGLSCTACANPIATPTVNTTYTVVASVNGCVAIDSVTISISTGKLVIYSGITPNGDGNNDTWVIDNIDLYQTNSVTIFNRWGIEVWSGNNYNNSTVVWKGQNSSGQPLPDATYFYIVKVDSATYKGWVQLTR